MRWSQFVMTWQDDIPEQDEVGGGGRWYYWVSFCPAQENLSTLQGNGSYTIIWLEHHGGSKGENVHSDGSKLPRGIPHLSLVLSPLVEWCRNQSMWLSSPQAKSAYCEVRFPCLWRGYLSSHGTSLLPAWSLITMDHLLQCLFEPRVIQFDVKRPPRRNTPNSMVTDEIVEQTSDIIVRYLRQSWTLHLQPHQTNAMIISTRHLMPGTTTEESTTKSKLTTQASGMWCPSSLMLIGR